MCQKVFPDGNSLSYQIEAVREKLKQKHTIENESSLRFQKVKIFKSTVLRERIHSKPLCPCEPLFECPDELIQFLIQ